MDTVITLAKEQGWGAHIKVSVAPTPAADAAAAAFLRRATHYEIGQEYAVAHLKDEGSKLGLCLSSVLFPLCEHGMSLELCAGPQHYYMDEEERAHYGY